MTDADVPGCLALNPAEASFRPHDLFGDPMPGIARMPVDFNAETRVGSFPVRLDPCSRSLPHAHSGGGDSFILEGERVDGDGRRFGPGDIVSCRAGSRHASQSPRGCSILVFLHGPNPVLGPQEP